jgi:hypothetical protein
VTVHAFSEWLAATAVSNQIRAAAWIIPTVQSVHIVAICVVIASALLLNLRLLGAARGEVPLAAYVRRYVPWLGCAVLVLLLSGLTLIVSEPGRTLGNWVFWTKMTLVGTGVCLTTVSAVPVRRDSFYWDKGSRRRLAGVLAVVALGVWIGVVICGRWIAYVL